MADQAEDLTLYVTRDVNRVHTAECPHMGPETLASLVQATPEQVEQLPLCNSCRRILNGSRRRRYDSLESALEAFQMPLANRPRVREIAGGLQYSNVWTVAGGSYIAVADAPGTTALAYFAKGYADVHLPGGGYEREWLPVTTRGGGGERSGSSDPSEPAPVCPTCHQVLPLTKVCDNCA